MSRIFEALQRSNAKKVGAGTAGSAVDAAAVLSGLDSDATNLNLIPSLTVTATPERRLVALSEDRSLGAEKIRILGARLRHLRQERPLKTLLITSSIKQEGKSVLSANLALSFAKTKQRVLLLEGDCHQPSIAGLFGASGLPGLTGWWRSGEPVVNYLRRINGLPLWFLPAGVSAEQPLEILQSQRFSQLLNQIGNWFDWVVIDSPPFAALADAAVWGGMSDGILLLARQHRTPKRVLRKVLDSIDRSKVLGIVLNDCSDPDHSYYAQYYSQNLDHAPQPANHKRKH